MSRGFAPSLRWIYDFWYSYSPCPVAFACPDAFFIWCRCFAPPRFDAFFILVLRDFDAGRKHVFYFWFGMARLRLVHSLWFLIWCGSASPRPSLVESISWDVLQKFQIRLMLDRILPQVINWKSSRHCHTQNPNQENPKPPRPIIFDSLSQGIAPLSE